MQNIFLIILFTSLFSGLTVTFLGNRIGLLKFYYLFFIFFFVALFCLIFQLYFLICTRSKIDFELITVLSFEDYFLRFSFSFDILTNIMLFIVTFVSLCVCLFSVWYMKNDPNHFKFLNYLNFFMFFMIILVTGNNLLTVFIGWEGIGIFSYLLINFWNDRLNANRSAYKAIFVNKIGDLFLLVVISIFYYLFSNLNLNFSKDYISFFMNVENVISNLDLLTLLCLSLFISGVAKSAQFILHVWLPDAMEGPTPVSALLHAATMVTAGAYVLLKFNWVLILNNEIFYLIFLIGILTNFMSSFIAVFQFDIKKIIAYSTASQMGLIFIAIGIYKPALAFYHLFNHAFFKALLFMLAGILIHFIISKQDLRFINNLKSEKYFLYSGFLISLITLSGIPFLSSFYSKDLIIQASFLNAQVIPFFVTLFLLFSVSTTVTYSLKILFSMYLLDETKFKISPRKSYFYNLKNVLEIKHLIYTLIIFSIISGFVFFDVFTYEDVFFSDLAMQNFLLEKLKDSIENEYLYALGITYISTITLYFYLFYSSVRKIIYTRLFLDINNIFTRKFYFDPISFYITSFFLATRNFSREEKPLNENTWTSYFKRKIITIKKVIKFLVSSTTSIIITLFFIIGDIILLINFTKYFIIIALSMFVLYPSFTWLEKKWKGRKK